MFVLSSLSKAINVYLALDPEAPSRLKKLKGHVITIELLPFHFIFQCTFDEQGILLHPGEHLSADVKIQGTPIQMLGTVALKQDRHHFFSEDLIITGSAEIGQDVIHLFDEVDIAWEEYLSKITGDAPAHHAGQLLRRLKGWLSDTEQTFTHHIDEYFHEEIAILPPREALQDLFEEIDIFRMDVDRMEIKINNLSQKFMDKDINE
ncbi:MAG: hypothetical protein A3F12_02875 [Gammaproteobacteria bacterium RIFCSPHIGHO2_12_FULL_38_14]|nr:MAG: hypothetical protein A3F12_02875 [Gammaproteobacteria bacterium RIFCSPHIGHO2_12_FULL_38_14]